MGSRIPLLPNDRDGPEYEYDVDDPDDPHILHFDPSLWDSGQLWLSDSEFDTLCLQNPKVKALVQTVQTLSSALIVIGWKKWADRLRKRCAALKMR